MVHCKNARQTAAENSKGLKELKVKYNRGKCLLDCLLVCLSQILNIKISLLLDGLERTGESVICTTARPRKRLVKIPSAQQM